MSPETITLDHAIYVNDGPVHDYEIHKSIITGKRHLITRGYYWEATFAYHLFKEADPKAKFNAIYNRINDEALYYRNGESAAPFRDALNEVVLFRITNLTPFYVTDTFDYDGLMITIKSVDFVKLYLSDGDIRDPEEEVPPTLYVELPWTDQNNDSIIDSNNADILLRGVNLS